MPIAARITHDVGVEIMLHRIRGRGPHAPASGIPTDDQGINFHRDQNASQRRPEKRTAELLFDDQFSLARFAFCCLLRVVSKGVVRVEAAQRFW